MNRTAEAEWVRRQAEIMRQRAENAKSDKERDFIGARQTTMPRGWRDWRKKND